MNNKWKHFNSIKVCTNIWLSVWSGDTPVNGTSDRELLNLRLGVYGGLGVAQSKGLVRCGFY